MRPISKGTSPIQNNFNKYEEAFDYLVLRISQGSYKNIPIAQYCNYCERPIPTNLAVEHIEPKNGAYAKPLLEKVWSNFLLACVNCNSTKGRKKVDFTALYFPDRDNTFAALEYLPDGLIEPANYLSSAQKVIAKNTIQLVGLNAEIKSDLNGVALDRRTQRVNIWLLALDALQDYESAPDNLVHQKIIIKDMVATGFFSIWMTVFKQHANIRKMFIDSITGTRKSLCFDKNSNVISPHPNTDNLADGSKI